MTANADRFLTLLWEFGEACYQDGKAENVKAVDAAIVLKKATLRALMAYLRTMTTEDLQSL